MKKLIYSLAAILALGGLWIITQPADVHAKYISGESKTIYLNVRKPKYTIVFDANADASEITGTMENQVFNYGEAQNLRMNTYHREGYGFVNWNMEPDGSGTSYADEQQIENLSYMDGTTITLYAQWGSPMPIVFEQIGVCEFNGEINGVGQPITGDECTAFSGQTYIDTGKLLYSQDNYPLDFEIGFKIVEYHSGENENQATFATAKYESGSDNAGNPGFAVRKSSDKIEITQMINYNKKATASFSAGSITEVKVARVDEKVYYSINGGDFIQLQSNVGTSDYHNVPMWFGAAPAITYDDQGNMILTPRRFLKAKLSNIYIKMGDYDSLKHTITFHAGEGATVNPGTKVLLGDSMMGSMPIPVLADHAFEGWYTADGTRIRSDSFITSNMDLYAHWSEDTNICEVTVDNVAVGRGASLASCIAAAGTQPATITVLADMHENVTVGVGQDITFDLGDNIWSDGGNAAVITNNGKVHIINGTIMSSQNNAVINNVKARTSDPSPELYITGGTIIATGIKQAVYNKDGGYVEISGTNTYLSSTSSGKATVQNLSNGRMVILGGTIESKGFVGILNESSAQSLVIGEQGNGIHQTNPTIRGANYGVNTSANIEFYDGVLMGVSGAINNQSRIGDNHDGTLTSGTEEINGITYQTLRNE